MSIFAVFRPLLRLHKVTSDAAEVMIFRPNRVAEPEFGSDTWRAAIGLFGLATMLALVSDKAPVALAIVLGVFCSGMLVWWGRVGPGAARKAYLVMSAGAFVQFLSAIAPRWELGFSTWFVIAFMVAMRPPADSPD